MSGLMHAVDVAADQMEAMGFGGRQMMKFVRCALQKILDPNCLLTPILPRVLPVLMDAVSHSLNPDTSESRCTAR